jgi:3-oxoacyl-[acyl-carrier-protein] synthase II
MKPRRVVITGIGVVAPNGIGKDAFWDALVRGKSGISRITSFDPSDLPTQIAGEVRDFDPTQFIPGDESKTMSRQNQLAVAAAFLALQDAGMTLTNGSEAGASFIGTSNPSYDLIETEFIKMTGPEGIFGAFPWALRVIDPFSSCSAVSRLTGLRNTSTTFSTSCTAGLVSIGHAFQQIRAGSLKIALAGGADAPIFRTSLLFFCAAGILSRRNSAPEAASRPFDKARDGGVLAEGAAVLVLEDWERATSRGASIYAEVLGYGNSGRSVVANDLSESIKEAMVRALADASLTPTGVDYVCAHAPSDPVTDAAETLALKQVFGSHAYEFAVSSIKSCIGNPLSAAGPMQVAAAALAIRNGLIPPTINLETPDPQCDLDYVPWRARRANLQIALINSHGVNGTDASLILGRFTQ